MHRKHRRIVSLVTRRRYAQKSPIQGIDVNSEVSPMRVLLSNDDGIDAPGLRVLREIAAAVS
ncbi:MAG: Survival protein SurE, partial [Pseudomonadota bacterium]